MFLQFPIGIYWNAESNNNCPPIYITKVSLSVTNTTVTKCINRVSIENSCAWLPRPASTTSTIKPTSNNINWIWIDKEVTNYVINAFCAYIGIQLEFYYNIIICIRICLLWSHREPTHKNFPRHSLTIIMSIMDLITYCAQISSGRRRRVNGQGSLNMCPDTNRFQSKLIMGSILVSFVILFRS